jgi:hypothetical protein
MFGLQIHDPEMAVELLSTAGQSILMSIFFKNIIQFAPNKPILVGNQWTFSQPGHVNKSTG